MEQILTKVLHSQVKPTSAKWESGFEHNLFFGCASCLTPVLTGTPPAASGKEQMLQEEAPKLQGDAAQPAF